MKYLGELISFYHGKDASTQKFILAQIFDYCPDLDCDDVSRLLWKELSAGESVVRRQARHVLGEFLPRQSSYGVGLWGGPSGDDPDASYRASNPSDVSALIHGASHCLEKHLKHLTGMAGQCDAEARSLISLVQGCLWVPDIARQLVQQVTGDSVNFASAFSLAEIGGAVAQSAILRAVKTHGRARPDLYMLLRAFPGQATFDALREETPLTTSYGRMNIALALATQTRDSARDLLEQLIRRKEGWVTACALHAIAGFGHADDFPLVQAAYELETHEFIRIQAVRAAGAIPGQAAVGFCLERLAEPSGRIQSAAVEALSGRGVCVDVLMPHVRPLLDSKYVRARVQAILVAAAADPELPTESLVGLLLSPEPVLRREGAYVLSFLQAQGSASLLERMAREDPSPEVKTDAIFSLARFARAEALPRLLALAQSGEALIVETACRALARLPLDSLGDELEPLQKLAGQGLPPALAAPVLRAVGLAAARAGQAPPSCLMDALSSTEPELVLAALGGLKPIGNEVPKDALVGLLGHGDPRIRALAAEVSFLAGRVESTDALLKLLVDGDEVAAKEAMRVLLELGHVVPCAPVSPRFSNVVARLKEPVVKLRLVRPAQDMPDVAASIVDPARAPRSTRLERVSTGAIPCPPRMLMASADNAFIRSYRSATASTPVPVPGAESPDFMSTAVPAPKGLPEDQSNVLQRPRITRPPERPPVVERQHSAERPVLAGGRAADAVRGVFARPESLWWVLLVVPIVLISALVLRSVLVSKPQPVDDAPGASGQPTTIRVWSLSGACTRQPAKGPTKPLMMGDQIFVGDDVSTEAESRLQLQDRTGSTLTLEPSSSFKIVSFKDTPGKLSGLHYSFREPTGGVTLDFRRQDVLEVQIGKRTISVKRGALQVKDTPQGKVVTVTSGEAVVLDGGKRERGLAAGESMTLPPG